MAFTVYVLYTDVYDKHYTGYSSNLPERIRLHNDLGNDWTKNYRPWRLIYTRIFEEKTAALQYEKWLKTGIGRRFIQTLPH